MLRAIRHPDAILVAEQTVHRHGVVQRLPALRLVLGAAGDEERPGRDQRMEFMEIITFLHHGLVRTDSRMLLGQDAAGPELTSRRITEVPGLPVIHVGTRLVKNDAGVGDADGRELLGQRAGKQRPLPSIGVPHHADSLRIHLRALSQPGGGVGRNVRQVRKRLKLRLIPCRIVEVGVGAGRRGVLSQAQGREPALDHLVTEVVLLTAVGLDSRAVLGIVEDVEHGRERARSFRSQQVRRGLPSRSDLEIDPAPDEAFGGVAPLFLAVGLLEEGRPLPEEPVPFFEELLAPFLPVFLRLNPASFFKLEYRTEGPEVILELCRRAKEKLDLLPDFLCRR